jgi:hypothetical protein
MKKIFKTFIILGLVASSTSCKKYLDVNTNPNDVTTATPDLIMPQALAATGALSYTFNGPAYGMDLGGYIANAGGVGGFGNFWTFVFNSGDANGLWTGTFDNLQDYQYILNNTSTTGDYKNYNAVARLMKAFDYLRLVDAYGDVPYTQALQGAANLTPAYDKGADVYKACITEIDNALTQLKVAPTATTVSLASNPAGKVDVTVYSTNTTNNVLSYNSSALLNGKDMTNWIKFANTIKLRALIRIQNVAALSSFYATEKATMTALTTADFISADVLINPGYVQQSGKQNPLWNGLAWSYTGTNSTASYLPSTFVTAFYNGVKLTDGKKAAPSTTTPSDDGRGNLIYRDYQHSNQLGFQSTSLVANPTGGEWYVGTSGNGAPSGLAATGYGVQKGFDQGQPLITAAESYFLQAEAAMIGLISGTPATLFDNGITASFAYLDKDHLDVVATRFNITTQVATYKADNPTSYLVNFALATTNAQRLEAIITQKYIALNTLNSDEGWNEYRRTLYPLSNPAGNASQTFAASFQTNTSPRADKLAGRILYPSSEYSLNTANVPVVNVNSTLVFWDARPTN